MKGFAKTSLWFILLLIMGVSVIGCGNEREDRTDPGLLVVVRDWFDVGVDSWNELHVLLDVPKTGPEYLRDSVNLFLSRTLFDLCNDLCPGAYSFDDINDKVFNGYFGGVVDCYYEAYGSLVDKEDIGWVGVTCLMIAQTESFITYGVEYYGCGGSCGSSLYTYTFNKEDGHLIGDVISEKELAGFLHDHLDDNLPLHDYQKAKLALKAEFTEDEGGLFRVGLLNDGALFVNEDWMNHYSVGKIDYEDLSHYLSKEARELISTSEDSEKYTYEDWCLGVSIGTVLTDKDELIHLMQRPPLWYSFPGFGSEDDFFTQNQVYTLTPYVLSSDYRHYLKYGGQLFPNASRLEFEFPDCAWDGPAQLREGDCYIMEDSILFAPSAEGCQVEYEMFRFDGRRFVRLAKDEYKAPSYEDLAVLKHAVYGDEIHLVDLCDHEFSGECSYFVATYTVRDGVYIPYKAFLDGKGSYSMSDLWDNPVSSGPQGAASYYHPEDSSLYLPIVERLGMSTYRTFDQFFVYRYNGRHFVDAGNHGGFWLHPSIRDFAALDYVGKTKDYLVRIDAMRLYHLDHDDEYEAAQTDTCIYRYAAWKHKDNMWDTPDIVIENGYYDSFKGGYVFENMGYKYVVGDELNVYKGNQLVLKQELTDIVTDDD
jgi:hypothetical protein